MTKITGAPPARRAYGSGGLYFDKARDAYRVEVPLPGPGRRRLRADLPKGTTKRQAQAELTRLQAEAAKGLVGSTDRLGPFLEHWLESQANTVGTGAGDRSPNTLVNYRWALRPVIAALGDKRLRELTAEDVEGLLAELAEGGLARRSVTRVRAVLSKALDDAAKRRHVDWNAAHYATVPTAKLKPLPEARTLSEAQAEAVLAAARADGTEMTAFFETGMKLCLRPGELLGLRWADVDYATGYLTLSGALKRDPGGHTRLGDVKTPGSRRALAMPATVVAALQAHQAAQAEARKAAGAAWQIHGLVFCTALGTPYGFSNMDREVRRVTDAAGLDGRWSMTELSRKTGVSILSARGASQQDLADMLGHRDTRMLKHYRTQLRPNDAHVALWEPTAKGEPK
jgi:integrase